MLLLLDESVPQPLRHAFTGHEVRTVAYEGWSAYENGELLSRAEAAGFHVLITADQSIEFQQNPKGRRIAVIVLAASSNAIEALRPLVPNVLHALSGIEPGELRVIRTLPL